MLSFFSGSPVPPAELEGCGEAFAFRFAPTPGCFELLRDDFGMVRDAADEELLAELLAAEDELEDESSAAATPWPVATAVSNHAETARLP